MVDYQFYILFIKNIVMGKGDKKTRRGKIVMGSYGKRRPGRKKQLVKSQTAQEDSK